MSGELLNHRIFKRNSILYNNNTNNNDALLNVDNNSSINNSSINNSSINDSSINNSSNGSSIINSSNRSSFINSSNRSSFINSSNRTSIFNNINNISNKTHLLINSTNNTNTASNNANTNVFNPANRKSIYKRSSITTSSNPLNIANNKTDGSVLNPNIPNGIIKNESPSLKSTKQTTSLTDVTPSPSAFKLASPSFRPSSPDIKVFNKPSSPNIKSSSPRFKPTSPLFKISSPLFKTSSPLSSPSFKPSSPPFKPLSPSFKPPSQSTQNASPSLKSSDPFNSLNLINQLNSQISNYNKNQNQNINLNDPIIDSKSVFSLSTPNALLPTRKSINSSHGSIVLMQSPSIQTSTIITTPALHRTSDNFGQSNNSKSRSNSSFGQNLLLQSPELINSNSSFGPNLISQSPLLKSTSEQVRKSSIGSIGKNSTGRPSLFGMPSSSGTGRVINSNRNINFSPALSANKINFKGPEINFLKTVPDNNSKPMMPSAINTKNLKTSVTSITDSTRTTTVMSPVYSFKLTDSSNIEPLVMSPQIELSRSVSMQQRSSRNSIMNQSIIHTICVSPEFCLSSGSSRSEINDFLAAVSFLQSLGTTSEYCNYALNAGVHPFISSLGFLIDNSEAFEEALRDFCDIVVLGTDYSAFIDVIDPLVELFKFYPDDLSIHTHLMLIVSRIVTNNDCCRLFASSRVSDIVTMLKDSRGMITDSNYTMHLLKVLVNLSRIAFSAEVFFKSDTFKLVSDLITEFRTNYPLILPAIECLSNFVFWSKKCALKAVECGATEFLLMILVASQNKKELVRAVLNFFLSICTHDEVVYILFKKDMFVAALNSLAANFLIKDATIIELCRSIQFKHDSRIPNSGSVAEVPAEDALRIAADILSKPNMDDISLSKSIRILVHAAPSSIFTVLVKRGLIGNLLKICHKNKNSDVFVNLIISAFNNYVSIHKEVVDSILELNGIAILIKILRAFMKDLAIQLSSMSLLCSMTRYNHVKTIIGIQGGIGMIFDSMKNHSSNETILTKGSNSLANLSFKNNANVNIVTQLGIVQFIIKKMNEFPLLVSFQTNCVDFIFNISTDSPSNIELLGKIGGIGCIIDLISNYYQESYIFDIATCLLLKLQPYISHTPLKTLIDLMEPLIGGMMICPENCEVAVNSFSLLTIIMNLFAKKHSSVSMKQVSFDLNGIDTLFEVFNKNSTVIPVQQAFLRLLESICNDSAMIVPIVQKGGVRAILDSMLYKNNSEQLPYYLGLLSLLNINDSCAEVIRKSGCVEAFLIILNTYCDRIDLMEHTFSCIEKLTSYSSLATHFSASRTIRFLIDFYLSHTDNLLVLETLSKILTHIVIDDKSSSQIGKELLKPIKEILPGQSDNSGFVKISCRLLSVLSKYSYAASLMNDLLYIPFLCNLLMVNSSNPLLLSYIVITFGNLCAHDNRAGSRLEDVAAEALINNLKLKHSQNSAFLMAYDHFSKEFAKYTSVYCLQFRPSIDEAVDNKINAVNEKILLESATKEKTSQVIAKVASEIINYSLKKMLLDGNIFVLHYYYNAPRPQKVYLSDNYSTLIISDPRGLRDEIHFPVNSIKEINPAVSKSASKMFSIIGDTTIVRENALGISFLSSNLKPFWLEASSSLEAGKWYTALSKLIEVNRLFQ